MVTGVQTCSSDLATLASASVFLETLEPSCTEVTFQSRSGPLIVYRRDELLAMDFPASPPRPFKPPPALIEALGAHAHTWMKGIYAMAVFDDEESVLALQPDFPALAALEPVVATAPGREADFVSRFFAPSHGVNEDPVTGSSHCTLTPYWSKRLGRDRLSARQVSARGGELLCEAAGERVIIAGRTARYLEGYIKLA